MCIYHTGENEFIFQVEYLYFRCFEAELLR